eukprot:EST43469.1 Major facilitator superfamily protein [Spironucleus salmonicida]
MRSFNEVIKFNKQHDQNIQQLVPAAQLDFKPPLFNKKNKTPVNSLSSKIFFVILVGSIPQFLYTFTNSSLYSFTVFYSNYYNVTIPQIQLVQHAEVIIITSIGLFSSKIHKFLTIPNGFLIFSFFIGLFNILIYFNKTFEYLIVMRIFGAIGYTVIYTSTAPLMNQFVYPGNLTAAMTINDLLIPFGELLGIIINILILDYDPQLLFLIAGILGMIHFLYCAFCIPRLPFNKKVKFNLILILLSISGMSLIVVSFALLAINTEIYIYILTFIFGTILISGFFYLNYKSKIQTLPSEIFNKNTIVFIILNFLMSFSQQTINWFIPLIWRIEFKFTFLESGFYQGFNHIIACCFVVLILLIQKKVTYRRILFCSNLFHCLVYFCLVFTFQFFQNQYFIQFLALLLEVNFTLFLVSIQVFNILASPKRFGFISGSIVAIAAKLGWSVGTSIFTAISRAFTSYFQSAQICAILSLIINFFGMCLSYFIGVFAWERGKFGFTEALAAHSIAFVEDTFIGTAEVALAEQDPGLYVGWGRMDEILI